MSEPQAQAPASSFWSPHSPQSHDLRAPGQEGTLLVTRRDVGAQALLGGGDGADPKAARTWCRRTRGFSRAPGPAPLHLPGREPHSPWHL